MEPKRSIIIIGAGMGGLSAGIYGQGPGEGLNAEVSGDE